MPSCSVRAFRIGRVRDGDCIGRCGRRLELSRAKPSYVGDVDLPRLRRALSNRRETRRSADSDVARAAVAAVLRGGSNGVEVLMIRRAAHPNDPWSGHMALPGGRFESPDTSLFETATRETREEVSLDLDRHGELIGKLDEVSTPPRTLARPLLITPYVFELVGAPPTLVPNHEVAQLYWIALEPIVRGEADDVFEYQHEGTRLELPAWRVEGQVVWGLTHRMLSSLLELV